MPDIPPKALRRSQAEVSQDSRCNQCRLWHSGTPTRPTGVFQDISSQSLVRTDCLTKKTVLGSQRFTAHTAPRSGSPRHLSIEQAPMPVAAVVQLSS